jgi:hypothetical protein
MSEAVVVSTNIPQSDEGRIPSGTIEALDGAPFIHGGHYATMISPEYTDVYEGHIKLVMAGIVLFSTDYVPMPDGTSQKASIFGFNIASYTTHGVETCLLVPSLGRLFLDLFEGNHDNAMHGYHGRLIAQTNHALAIGKSPYRLEPLDVQ